MASASAKSQSKTAFVRDFIKKNPSANRRAVEDAWLEAGYEGPIHSSLVSNLRRELGLTGQTPLGAGSANGEGAVGPGKGRGPKGKRRGRRRSRVATGANASPAKERQTQAGGLGKALAEIEGDIDRLIFKLMAVGDCEGIEDELRKVRRLLYRRTQA